MAEVEETAVPIYPEMSKEALVDELRRAVASGCVEQTVIQSLNIEFLNVGGYRELVNREAYKTLALGALSGANIAKFYPLEVRQDVHPQGVQERVSVVFMSPETYDKILRLLGLRVDMTGVYHLSGGESEQG